MTFQLPSLPYATDALEPHLSADTLDTHYGKHHRGYVTKLNALLEEQGRASDSTSLRALVTKLDDGPVFRNAAQAWNHAFYWNSLTPSGAPISDGQLKKTIERDFGGMEPLKKRFTEAALSLFGSGWTWLVQSPTGELKIVNTRNADCPVREGLNPLLTCDVWEHAYYLDYKNMRADYFDAWWNLANWDFAEECASGSPFNL